MGLSSEKSFVHLHNHSCYSMLDGKSELDDLYATAGKLGMPALAVTDHGNLHGAYNAYKAGKKHDVKAIIGLETYVAPGNTSRTERKRVTWGSGDGDDVSGSGAFHHMTLLAENNTGLHNLFKLSSESFMTGFYRKPRADKELFDEFHEGLIATTGCPSGEVQTWLRLGEYDNAVTAAGELQTIFGRDNFFLELMDHGLDIEYRVREDLLRIAKKLNIPLLATNDSHYIRREDAKAHSDMLCVQSGSKLSDPNRFQFNGDGYYIKTAEEMRDLFAELPDACDNTLLIAERCQVSFTENADLMPKFPIPVGETSDSWLRKEVQRGLERRYPKGIPDDRQTQADYEVDVITNMGFPGYFLVTAEFCQWAKDQGIRVGPGRGSAAGSIVAYALRITELDPIEHKLLFERFLNPERVSMPDIDIDFDDLRRGEVIQHVTDKYGADHTAQLVTFGYVKAKAAIKDASRILGKPYALGDRITKLYPAPVQGKDMPLKGLFDPTHQRYNEGADLRDLVATDPDVKEVLDVAVGLEGVIRQSGVHAAGVILGGDVLTEHIPIMKRESDGAIITQFEQKVCETLGLLKMDFLGLRNLTIITDALNHIKNRTNVNLILEDLTMNDPATFELLQHGDTLGVFQLDSAPIRGLLRSMRPTEFKDIAAVLALYRPGPMGANAHTDYADRKNNRQQVTPIHPELGKALSEILGDTYQILVYQEQVMAIAQQLAGYTLGEADLLRRAMGKKDEKVLQGEYEKFSAGMRANGYSVDSVQKLWTVILPFAAYAFNLAHAASYGVISYWTAFLKANHPAEYMSALLTSVESDKDKTALYVNECRRMGITLTPPCVNESGAHYTPVDDQTIRVGLSVIRNVGHNVVTGILTTRQMGGIFSSWEDFLGRTVNAGLNKRSVDSLIKAGGFEMLHSNRAALASVHETAVDQVAAFRKKAKNQDDLFETFAAQSGGEQLFNLNLHIPNDVEVPDWDRSQKLTFEREMLGQYVSDHPLRGMQQSLDKYSDGRIIDLFPPDSPPQRRDTVTLTGIVTSVVTKKTKKGDAYVIVSVEDTTGAVEITAFPGTFARNPDVWASDQVLAAKIKIDMREDDSYILVGSSARIIVPTLDKDTSSGAHPKNVTPKPIPAAGVTIPNAGRVGENKTFTPPNHNATSSHMRLTLSVNNADCTTHLLQQVRTSLEKFSGTVPVFLQVLDSEGGSSMLALPEVLHVTLTRDLVHDLKGLVGGNNVSVNSPPASPPTNN